MALPSPIPVTLPACLDGQLNGKLPDSILSDTPGLGGGPMVRLVPPAARSWRAMTDAAGRVGIVLAATSLVDSYRPYPVQYNVFVDRYWPDPEPGFIGERYWPGHYDLVGNWVRGHDWYQKPRTAVAAVPGTSNHGRGLAVDVAGAGGARLEWLLANAKGFGWSWEIESEPWHIRYCTGDAIPLAVRIHEGGTDMGTYVLSGFPGQPAETQGRYHVADPWGYHVAPLEPGWMQTCWPGAPVLKPGAPVPTKYTYQQVLDVLFGVPRPGTDGALPPEQLAVVAAAAERGAAAGVDDALDDATITTTIDTGEAG